VAEVGRLAADYGRKVDQLAAAMGAVLSDEPFAKEHADVARAWAELHRQLSENLALMRGKAQAPREPVSIASTQDAFGSVSKAIAEINARIDVYNARISDRGSERGRIKGGFWKRLRFDHKGSLSVYAASKTSTDESLNAIAAETSDLTGKLAEANTKLSGLRASTSGTDKAVEAINARLASLGIDAFKIKKQDGEGHLYHLDRTGVGADEYRSLSEGEKTLISFFYFVELINGSVAADASVPLNRKIVVIDDPVSSLSHNYVYDIASVIVHDIINLKEDDGRQLKQVIVLTHSLFFHHEMILAHGKAKQLEFRRVIKHDHSDVVPMEKNDLLNDYEAFWQVIRDAKVGKASRVSVPNSMRCIFERFFSFTMRQEDFKEALRGMSQEDHTFTALSRYLDRQSHADGINRTDFGDHDVGYYLEKFRGVFVETGQLAHYNAMMEEDSTGDIAVSGVGATAAVD
jgi:wobble nucleotide-excising tRNase